MYFPYLRSKQFELIALKEFSNEHENCRTIVPIIEPVKNPITIMQRALYEMGTNGLEYFVVLNPYLGDFAHIAVNDIVYEGCKDLPHFNPAFLCNNTNIGDIIQCLEKWNLNEVMIIFKDTINGSDANVMSLLLSTKVKYVVGEFGRSLKKHLLEGRKSLITLGDYYKVQPSNADYDKIPDEKYSEEHYFYEEEGYVGFSDYCVLPKIMLDGGMTPAAVAIHLTYKKNEEEIWVYHYVSDTKYGKQNIQLKFKEAALKVKNRYEFEHIVKTNAVNNLITNLEDEKYPGLGVLKKYSVLNHLELIFNIL